MKDRGGKGLDGKLVASIYTQIFSAVKFMHDNNVLHRDIKPENILIDEQLNPKICDFGWATEVQKDQPRMTFCGTYEYMAPEIFESEQYNDSVDVWSLGILLYEMLHGSSPFVGKSVFNIYKNILKEDINFKRDIDSGAVDLILKILKTDPQKRPSIDDMTNHPYIMKHVNNIYNQFEDNSREDNNADAIIYNSNVTILKNAGRSDDEKAHEATFELLQSYGSKDYEGSSDDDNISQELQDCVEFVDNTKMNEKATFNSKKQNLTKMKSNLSCSQDFGVVFKTMKSKSQVRNQKPRKLNKVVSFKEIKQKTKDQHFPFYAHHKKPSLHIKSAQISLRNSKKPAKKRFINKKVINSKTVNKTAIGFKSSKNTRKNTFTEIKEKIKNRVSSYVLKSKTSKGKQPKKSSHNIYDDRNTLGIEEETCSLEIEIPDSSPEKAQQTEVNPKKKAKFPYKLDLTPKFSKRSKQVKNQSFINNSNPKYATNIQGKKRFETSLNSSLQVKRKDLPFQKNNSKLTFRKLVGNDSFMQKNKSRSKLKTKSDYKSIAKNQNINIVINKFYNKTKFYCQENDYFNQKRKLSGKKSFRQDEGIGNKSDFFLNTKNNLRKSRNNN